MGNRGDYIRARGAAKSVSKGGSTRIQQYEILEAAPKPFVSGIALVPAEVAASAAAPVADLATA